MSEGNGTGVIKIGRKGVRKIQIADGQVMEVDVIDVHNQWADVDDAFRGPDRAIPPERRAEHLKAAHEFVTSVFGGQAMSRAEALEFLKVITEESLKLSDFFKVGSADAPSSPAPTELTYST